MAAEPDIEQAPKMLPPADLNRRKISYDRSGTAVGLVRSPDLLAAQLLSKCRRRPRMKRFLALF